MSDIYVPSGPISPAYELRCPKCGREEILVRGVCWVELATLREDGSLSVWDDSAREAQPDDVNDVLRCASCNARFYPNDLKLKP